MLENCHPCPWTLLSPMNLDRTRCPSNTALQRPADVVLSCWSVVFLVRLGSCRPPLSADVGRHRHMKDDRESRVGQRRTIFAGLRIVQATSIVLAARFVLMIVFSGGIGGVFGPHDPKNHGDGGSVDSGSESASVGAERGIARPIQD